MRFGPLPIEEAEGGIVAHSVRLDGLVLKKGARIDAAAIESLRAAGVAEIVVAKLDGDDVSEDAAAERLARVIAGSGATVERPFTGRSNLFAETAGVLVVDRPGIDRLNRVDEAVTVATQPAFRPVIAGEMIGTVKIIPFAVSRGVLEAAEAAIAGPLLRVAPYRPMKVGVVATVLPGLQEKVIAKTSRVLANRLAPAGARIGRELRSAHETGELAAALRLLAPESDLLIVFGASAVTDRRDVIPAAIERAGGRVDHFGMPVDPGNLLLIGELAGRLVIGAPGCARSPKENGFDWVLSRILADVPVTREDITGMGVGGLLMEIVTRPQPREGAATEPKPHPRVAAVVLAAGQSRRMGGPNKLVQTLAGKPLVRHAVETALASGAAPVIVVTGHQRAEVEAALAGLPVRVQHNPDYAEGLSTSLRTGISALGSEADGALVLLGDMPKVDATLLGSMIARFADAGGAGIVLPTRAGKRGNPVLWGRPFFERLCRIEGDVGARHLLGEYSDAVTEVPVEDDGVLTDVDTVEALEKLRSAPEITAS